ncbi:cyanophycinase, partial [Myxococcota bacterium]|nr:cyanophycinase [Myxococcota bacterium]
ARDAGLVAPAGLVRYLVGRAADRDVAPRGPGVIVMGGGPDVDEAFTWWRPLVAGGDVVVLRTSGADGYNDYLFTDIGGVDSVHTLLVTTRALADDAWVEAEVASAEAIFLAGGDQATYVDAWKGTGVERGLRAAWARGAVVGGTSAGAAVLGELVFGAHRGTVTSDEVLADPYDARVTIDDALVDLEPLRGVITDTHFAERDRMGRLVGFVARVLADGHRAPVRGLGVSEHTALVIGPDRVGTVLGTGHVYVVEGLVPAEVCAPGAPLTYRDVAYRTLAPGDTITLPRGTTTVPAETLDVEAGTLSPADPY